MGAVGITGGPYVAKNNGWFGGSCPSQVIAHLLTIQPLSTSVLRQEPGPLDHPPSELPQETDTPRRQRWPLRIAQNAGAVDRPADSHKPHELQVAVVIVMPGCNQECEGPRRKSKFADYNIGVTVVPWDKEL
jgi:hypothetical protein